MTSALPVGARVLFREGRWEHTGTVLEVRPDGMVLVGTKKVRVGDEMARAGSWQAKLIPASLLQVMPQE